jgi:hypothetical protein
MFTFISIIAANQIALISQSPLVSCFSAFLLRESGFTSRA